MIGLRKANQTVVAVCLAVLACSAGVADAILAESPEQIAEGKLAARAMQTLGARSFACLAGLEDEHLSLRVTTRRALKGARRLRRASGGVIKTVEVVPQGFSWALADRAYGAAVAAMSTFPATHTEWAMPAAPAKRGTCPAAVWIGVWVKEVAAVEAAEAVQARYKTAITLQVFEHELPRAFP
jgi:hypothetical protein